MKSFLNSKEIIVYHGTTIEHLDSLRNRINLDICDKYSDFGRGFYTTQNELYAKKFAIYKGKKLYKLYLRKNKIDYLRMLTPVIFKYRLEINSLSSLNCKYFTKSDDKWAEFVYNNRIKKNLQLLSNEHNRSNNYDFIYGKIADGKIALVLEDLIEGRISFKEFAYCIKPVNTSYQLSLHTKKALKHIELIDIKEYSINSLFT